MLDFSKIVGYLPYKLTYKDIPEGYSSIRVLTKENIDWFLSSGKPILQPLSSFAEFDSIIDEMSSFEIDMLRSKIDFGVEPSGGYCANVRYSAVQKMFENHIDVFDLLSKDLAININTIKN